MLTANINTYPFFPVSIPEGQGGLGRAARGVPEETVFPVLDQTYSGNHRRDGEGEDEGDGADEAQGKQTEGREGEEL